MAHVKPLAVFVDDNHLILSVCVGQPREKGRITFVGAKVVASEEICVSPEWLDRIVITLKNCTTQTLSKKVSADNGRSG